MKRFSIIIFVLMLMILSNTVYAAEDPLDSIDEVAPCPLYGLHRMEREAIGGAYYLGDFVMTVAYYECDCGEEMITHGDPHLGNPIYWYWYDTQFYVGSSYGVTGYHVDDPDGQYTTSSILPGYRFYP